MVASVSAGALIGSAVAGAATSSAGGLLNSGLGAYLQKQLMNYQAKINYKYGKKSAINQYTWQRKGLEKAGYNPILALGGAEGVANTGWTSQGSVNSNIDPGIDAQSAASLYLNAQEQKRQNKLADSQVDLNESEIQKNVYNSGLIEQQLVNQSIQNDFEIERQNSALTLNNIDAYLKYAQAENFLEQNKWIDPKARAEIQYMIDNGEASLSQAAAANKNAAAANKNADTNKKDYDLRKNIAEGSEDTFMTNLKKNHPNVYGFYRHADATLGILGRVLGGAGNFASAYGQYRPTVENVSVNHYGYDKKGNPVKRGTTNTHRTKGKR